MQYVRLGTREVEVGMLRKLIPARAVLRIRGIVDLVEVVQVEHQACTYERQQREENA